MLFGGSESMVFSFGMDGCSLEFLFFRVVFRGFTIGRRIELVLEILEIATFKKKIDFYNFVTNWIGIEENPEIASK